MRVVIKLIIKEYKLFINDRIAFTMSFIIPVALIFIWGLVFMDFGSGPMSLHLAFVNASRSQLAGKIEKVFDTTKTFVLIKSYEDENGKRVKFDTNSVKDYVRKGRGSAALVLPVDAYEDTSVGLKIKFYYDPRNDMEIRVIEGMIQQTIMAQVPDLFIEGMQRQAIKFLGADSGRAFNSEIASTVGKYFKIDPKWIKTPLQYDSGFSAGKSAAGKRNFFQNVLQVDHIQLVGQDIVNPWATRGVGGWAMMFLLFTLTATSTSLFDEKKSGVVLRLLASPVSRTQILWSKYLFNIMLGCVQLMVLFIAGAMLYQIDIFTNIFNLVLVIVASVAACTAFGMLLASISRTAAQASGFGMFLILAMSAIGGAWFPTAFMPAFIQTISKGTIVYWSMDGIQQVLWRGVGTYDILPHMGILFGIAFLITAVSIWQFKKGHVF